jgi:hypothetical protein
MKESKSIGLLAEQLTEEQLREALTDKYTDEITDAINLDTTAIINDNSVKIDIIKKIISDLEIDELQTSEVIMNSIIFTLIQSIQSILIWLSYSEDPEITKKLCKQFYSMDISFQKSDSQQDEFVLDDEDEL